MESSDRPDCEVRVFEITSYGPGDQSKDVVVDLPTRWAQHHDSVSVRLHDTDMFGVRATLVGRDGTDLLRFPWHDHADEQLLNAQACEYPVTLGEDGTWEDMEQGWWATITDVEGTLCIASTYFDALLDAPMPAADATCGEPGHVPSLRVQINWESVTRGAYDAARRAAVLALRGSLARSLILGALSRGRQRSSMGHCGGPAAGSGEMRSIICLAARFDPVRRSRRAR